MSRLVSRGWFRFSLRALFALTTALSCWLGYQVHWIRQREGLIEKHKALAMESSTFQFNAITGGEAGFVRGGLHPVGSEPEPRLPWSLRLLGQKPIYDVYLVFLRQRYDNAKDFNDEDIQLAVRLFPEATVHWRLYYSTSDL